MAFVAAPPSRDLVNSLTAFNAVLCASAGRWCKEHEASHKEWRERNPISDCSRPTEVPWHESHVLRRLFRALMAIVCCTDYNGEDSKSAGSFRVYLVRTGINEELSAPVSFRDEVAAKRMKYVPGSRNVVETTLEHATDFILALESRQDSIFGVRPDPASVAEILFDDEGKELTRTPTSQWVSDKRAAEWGWVGRGKMFDEEHAVNWERRGTHGYKRRKFEEQMAKEGRELPAQVMINGVPVVYRWEDDGGSGPVNETLGEGSSTQRGKRTTGKARPK
ncbi:hypothetical protein B0T16DRAFT_420997 [Cercophora newfieldiana]|uniref:Uncharacterized protein n=1 Tax=Cercophora newfieldiana TaxID=92897 RepID=A0AA40CKB1_9PEZI|nr:hypothetical protein B0T16DRAFT_420997 [Cercophora newfieldiana]